MAKKLEDDCIQWWGAVLPNGYGHITVQRERMRAHRFAWIECIGPIEPGAILHHKCHNKLCVNPNHLEPLDRATHNREHGQDVQFCPRGHPYDEENTYQRTDSKRGWVTRKCRACNREKEREKRYA